MTLISTKELKQATGAKTTPSLEKILRAQKIPFFYGKPGHIFTTLDALNGALGIKPERTEPDEIEFT